MTTAAAAPTGPLLWALLLFGAFVLLIAGIGRLARAAGLQPEHARKLLHVGSGCLTLAFPFVFDDVLPVVVLTGAGGALMLALKFLPLRAPLDGLACRVERRTLGEMCFPLSVGGVFVLAFEQDPVLFCVPILVLTAADAIAALVGTRWGRTRYGRGCKTVEGSIAFAVSTLLCVQAPLALSGRVDPASALAIAVVLTLPLALVEAAATCGLDNLAIPPVGYYLLTAAMAADGALLAERALFITVAALLVMAAHQVPARTRASVSAPAHAPCAALPHLRGELP